MKNFVIVTPAKNELANVPCIVKHIVEQSLLPSLWIFVNDNSDDGTESLFLEEIKKYTCFENECKILLVHNAIGNKEYGLGVKYSSVVRFGFDCLEKYENENKIEFDFIALLDCDVFPEANYYSILIEKLKNEPELGIVSGGMQKEIETNRSVRVPKYHAAGMMRVWRRKCFLQTGYFPSVSQDSISEARAVMMGWKVRSFREAAVCMRKMGAKTNYAYYGKSAYIFWRPQIDIWLYVTKLILQRKNKEAKEYLKGYYSAKKNKEKRIEDELVKKFYRYRLFYKLIGK